jgi:hypothetical protein
VNGDLPDFHIAHDEKIEWMIETHGFAIEAVPARSDADPPVPPCVYTVGFPSAVGFPEVAVLGLTPSAARGLIDLVADICRSVPDGPGSIPLGVPLTGVLDGEQRCIFAPIDLSVWGELFATAVAWHRRPGAGADGPFPEMVQMLWPDRAGWLPHEEGFEARLRYAQPVIGMIAQV